MGGASVGVGQWATTSSVISVLSLILPPSHGPDGGGPVHVLWSSRAITCHRALDSTQCWNCSQMLELMCFVFCSASYISC